MPSPEDTDLKWGNILKVRDALQNDPSATQKLKDTDDRIRALAANSPPQNPGLQRYMINRGLMQDPEDEAWGNPEVNPPRDASGASHFGPDN
jgi:hypothetical protein